jgi:quercetin dioxygenase-like cupin family protein
MDMLPVDSVTTEHMKLGTDEIAVLATSAQTGGALFAVEVRMPPGGGPPVMHRHAPGEVYYVLEGEFTFYAGHPNGPVQRVTASAGQVVPLVGGTPHTVRNESDSDALAFVVHAPGAPMEGFSRAAAELAAHGSPSMEAVLAIASQHGIELLGPIPELERGPAVSV